MISTVIPILNEEKLLKKREQWLRQVSSYTELIFVDGGSSDGSPEVARRIGRFLMAEKGRAVQMNCGAREARNDILLFLHIDTTVSPEALFHIKRCMQDNNIVGGCLTQRIAKKGLIYRLIEGFGNIRAKVTKVFYGDQGIFVRKDIFFSIGGFPEVPIMEDVLFTKTLRRVGRVVVLKDLIYVSARRLERDGIIKSIFIYTLVNLLFRLGIPLDKVRLLYSDIR